MTATERRPMKSEPSQAVDGLVEQLNTALNSVHTELKALRETRGRAPELSPLMKWAVGIVGSLIVAAIIGAHAMIWSLNDRLTTMETSKFTATQASQMEARIISRIERLPVYMDQVADHEVRLRALESVHRTAGGGGQ